MVGFRFGLYNGDRRPGVTSFSCSWDGIELKKAAPLEAASADGPGRHKDAVFLVAKIVKTSNLNHQPDPFNHQFVCL